MIKDQYSELQVETPTLWLHQLYKGEILLPTFRFPRIHTNMCNDVASHEIIEIPHYSQYLLPQQQNRRMVYFLCSCYIDELTKLSIFVIWSEPK